jgi:hypothetical protein
MRTGTIIKSFIAALFGLVFVFGCAALDLKTDVLPLSSDFGKVKPRIPFEKFEYFSGEPEKPYEKLADLVIQENPTVIASHSAKAMTSRLCKLAWEKGADALINVTVSTTNAAGGYARTSAVVKGTAIRWKE